VEDKTTSPALSDKDVNKLQQLTGTLLYYARAVDPTLIMPINVLASEQSKSTAVTADKVWIVCAHVRARSWVCGSGSSLTSTMWRG
jgi:hypothetical protein